MGIYNKEFGKFSPYLLNKKLKPSKKFDGKYVYFYPNDKKKHGYEMIYVSKEEWEVLVEQDRLEYSNNRRHDEKKSICKNFTSTITTRRIKLCSKKTSGEDLKISFAKVWIKANWFTVLTIQIFLSICLL